MKRRIDKLEKYRHIKDFKLLIVEKVNNNLYQTVGFESETFTADELEALKEMSLTEYDKQMIGKRAEAIERELFGVDK